MKITQTIITILFFSMLISCNNPIANQTANKEGFISIEKELKNTFGTNAFYTDLSITHNKAIGNIVTTTVTKAPESLKMGQWNLMQGNWKQNSEITLEVPQGSKASDFMFQLNDKINLATLGGLVEESCKKLTEEKKLENPKLHIASIKFPKNGMLEKTEYLVMLKPENGGTTFTFRYNISGNFIAMNY